MTRLSGAVARSVVLGVIGLCSASCSDDYLARRDTLSAGSGDAVRADIAMQVINPRPPGAYQVNGTTNGLFLQHAMDRYVNPASGTALAAPTAAGVAPGAGTVTP